MNSVTLKLRCAQPEILPNTLYTVCHTDESGIFSFLHIRLKNLVEQRINLYLKYYTILYSRVGWLGWAISRRQLRCIGIVVACAGKTSRDAQNRSKYIYFSYIFHGVRDTVSLFSEKNIFKLKEPPMCWKILFC